MDFTREFEEKGKENLKVILRTCHRKDDYK